jgi:hypothetical protein
MSRTRRDRAAIEGLLALAPADFGGGCSPEKAHVLLWLIKHGRLTASCDIGVYRGRSFFPQALAHLRYTGGVAYGIDPYSRTAAEQSDNPSIQEDLDQWVATTDFDALQRDVLATLESRHLTSNAEFLRMSSNQAVEVFRARSIHFGLVHVDGNHDSKEVLDDVRNYLPLLQPGGFLVLDDISWTSVRPAVDLVSTQFVHLYRRVDATNDYAVFWNGTSRVHAAYLRAALRRIGRA